jgi:hypothetical protein
LFSFVAAEVKMDGFWHFEAIFMKKRVSPTVPGVPGMIPGNPQITPETLEVVLEQWRLTLKFPGTPPGTLQMPWRTPGLPQETRRTPGRNREKPPGTREINWKIRPPHQGNPLVTMKVLKPS